MAWPRPTCGSSACGPGRVQPGDPLGLQHRREGAKHAWQAPGRHHRHSVADHLAPGTWAPCTATIGTTATPGSGRTCAAWSASKSAARRWGRGGGCHATAARMGRATPWSGHRRRHSVEDPTSAESSAPQLRYWVRRSRRPLPGPRQPQTACAAGAGRDAGIATLQIQAAIGEPIIGGVELAQVIGPTTPSATPSRSTSGTTPLMPYLWGTRRSMGDLCVAWLLLSSSRDSPLLESTAAS
jgi:hypothetical protein